MLLTCAKVGMLRLRLSLHSRSSVLAQHDRDVNRARQGLAEGHGCGLQESGAILRRIE
jgi:hypothetical protein